jgi:ribosomal protein L34
LFGDARQFGSSCCFGTWTPNATSRENKHGKREGAAAAAGRSSVRAARLKLRFWLVKGSLEPSLLTHAGASSSLHSSHLLSLTRAHALLIFATTAPPRLSTDPSFAASGHQLLSLRLERLTPHSNSKHHSHPELFVEPSGHSLLRHPTSSIHHRLQVKHRHHVSRRELGQVQE